MSKHFYKEKFILLKYCRVPGCKNVIYRPDKEDWRTKIGACPEHIKQFTTGKYKKGGFAKWLATQSPERQAEIKQGMKRTYELWVVRNLKRRREIALKSYHKHKREINKERRAKSRRIRRQRDRLLQASELP